MSNELWDSVKECKEVNLWFIAVRMEADYEGWVIVSVYAADSERSEEERSVFPGETEFFGSSDARDQIIML